MSNQAGRYGLRAEFMEGNPTDGKVRFFALPNNSVLSIGVSKELMILPPYSSYVFSYNNDQEKTISLWERILVDPELWDFAKKHSNNIYSMNHWFYNNERITEIDFKFFDSSKVTDMASTFQQCRNLKNIDLSEFDASKVTTMNSLFTGCYNLETVILGNKFQPNASISTTNRITFSSCYSLTTIVIQNADKVLALGAATALSTCYHFTGTVNATYNPLGLKDGKIFVPDELVAGYKEASIWSTYSDLIFPLSEMEVA